jgi:hypothetical protein
VDVSGVIVDYVKMLIKNAPYPEVIDIEKHMANATNFSTDHLSAPLNSSGR